MSLPLREMKKQSQSEGVKGKVLSGFFMLLILALGSVLIIIRLATQLTPPDSGTSESVIKLTLVSNMLSELIEANGQARTYITTGEKRYLARYRKLDKDIQKLADSLKYFSALQPEQYKRMLVVDSLLQIKRATMANFFRMRKEGDTLALYPEIIDKLKFDPNDSIEDSEPAVVRASGDKAVSTRSDEDESKQNFFKKIWDNVSGRKSKKDTLQRLPVQLKAKKDSLSIFALDRDTTIEMVKSQLQRMGEKERLVRQRSIERDLLLMRTDQVIMDEIRNVFLLFEKEEINRTIDDARHSRAVFKRLWNTAMTLAMLGLLTMIIFVILIWKDLARSNFYRRQLESARLLAEKLLKVKELFLANMSHEIRTPITSIIGFSEKLLTTKLSAEQENYLRYIDSSSEHLLGLVDDLLDYSRIESGTFNLDSVPFIPAYLFQHAFETLQFKAGLKGLEMHYASDLDTAQAVVGDPLRVRQIIYNLLNNSLKFTEQGAINLNVTSSLSGDKMRIDFIVADTGIGIPEEKQEEIFNEFTQVDVGITRRYGGSGLGLAICRKLVDLMQGEISLKSKPGSGTTISVGLELNLYHGVVAELTEGNRNVTINLKGYRVLLAEDDETTRILLAGSLKAFGAEVAVAADGESAWKLFSENPQAFDIVLTDIQMPNLSGPELAEKINRLSNEIQIPFPPVIGLTAHATGSEIEIFIQKGIQDVLIKPFRQYQLAELLGKVLKIACISMSESANTKPTNHRNINLESFLKYSGDDKEALNKILISLADSIHNTASELNTSFNKSNYLQVGLLSHRMLPNIRNLGGAAEAGILQKLETLCKSENPNKETVNSLLKNLMPGLVELESELRQLTENH